MYETDKELRDENIKNSVSCEVGQQERAKL